MYKRCASLYCESSRTSRTILKRMDMTTCRSAMSEKIRDSKETLKLRHMTRSVSIRNDLAEVGGRKSKLRKKIKVIRQRQMAAKLKRKNNFDMKIKHLREKMNELKEKYARPKGKKEAQPTKVPDRLKEYVSLCIFGSSKDLPAKQDLLGPYVYHRDISLSEGERLILSRDPKYCLTQPLDKTEFNLGGD